MVLIVGGPKDGEVASVEERLSRIEVVVDPEPMPLSYRASNPGAMTRYERVRYLVVPLHVGKGYEDRWIAHPEGWALAQAIDHLLDGYATKTRVLERHAREYGI